MATDRLVVASVCQVSILPNTVFGNEPLSLGFVFEFQRGTVGLSLVNEGASLPDILCKWLVFIQDLGVFASVILTDHVLLALIGVNLVADRVHVREGLGRLPIIEAVWPRDEGSQLVATFRFNRV